MKTSGGDGERGNETSPSLQDRGFVKPAKRHLALEVDLYCEEFRDRNQLM